MEINNTTICVYRMCRLYGFAPYKITKNKRNEIIALKLNWPLCVYSILLMIFFILSIEYAFLKYLYSGSSPRSKSMLSKLARGLDANISLAAFVIHTITSMLSVRNTLRVNNCLNKIDMQLNILNVNNELHSNKARRHITILLCVALFSMILMLNMNFWSQLIISKLQSNDQTIGIFRYDFNEIKYYRIPFYVMSTSLESIYGKCVTTIYRIGLRYRMLNDIICTHVTAANRSSLLQTLNREKLSNSLTRLFVIYETLGDVLNRVSSEFGLTLLFLLISSSFHITMVIYLIVMEILGNNDAVFLISQVLWLCAHIIRITVIVEPCHFVAFEAKRTRSCVSRLLLLNRNDSIVKQFWQKLMIVDHVSFSMCGLFQVDRSLLTSISAAVATFLVIVFQFGH